MMTEERALSWVDEQQLKVRIVEQTEDEALDDFYAILYGEGRNGHQHAQENLASALKQRGQHVRRS